MIRQSSDSSLPRIPSNRKRSEITWLLHLKELVGDNKSSKATKTSSCRRICRECSPSILFRLGLTVTQNYGYHTGHLKDLHSKMTSLSSTVTVQPSYGSMRRLANPAEVEKICPDADKMCCDISNGLRMQLIKNHIFKCPPGDDSSQPLDLASMSHV